MKRFPRSRLVPIILAAAIVPVAAGLLAVLILWLSMPSGPSEETLDEDHVSRMVEDAFGVPIPMPCTDIYGHSFALMVTYIYVRFTCPVDEMTGFLSAPHLPGEPVDLSVMSLEDLTMDYYAWWNPNELEGVEAFQSDWWTDDHAGHVDCITILVDGEQPGQQTLFLQLIVD